MVHEICKQEVVNGMLWWKQKVMVMVMVAVIMLLIVEVIQGMKRGVDIDVSLSILFVHSNEHDQYATCEKKRQSLTSMASG